MNKHAIRMCSILANEAYKSDLKSIKKSKLIENKNTDAQAHIAGHKNNIYVVCRGTSSVQDALIDIKMWRTKCDFLNNTLVHSGFLEQYVSIRDQINEEIRKLITENTIRIVFTGHSLGSALCTIAALDCKINNPEHHIECVTFASPRVGSKSFVKLFNKTVDISYRIVYHKDPVTFLPTCLRFRHVKGCIHFKKNGQVSISDKYFVPIGCFISQHFMEKYKESIEEWLNMSHKGNQIDLKI